MKKTLVEMFDSIFPLLAISGFYIISLFTATLIGRFDLALLDILIASVILPTIYWYGR